MSLRDSFTSILAACLGLALWCGAPEPAWGNGALSETHFPPPAMANPLYADYLVSFRVDGLPARPGDEVAFFDPDGVLCGLYVVPQAAPGEAPPEYFPVTVYGDDPGTPAVDEGARPGDTLAVKVWDSLAGMELSGGNVVLSSGPAIGIYQTSAIPPVWQNESFGVLKIDTAHFPSPDLVLYQNNPDDYVSFYVGAINIRSAPAETGDEVAAFDPSGWLCGQARIIDQGIFVLSIYGDDPATTGIKECAAEGDLLTFKVWGKRAGLEYGPGTQGYMFLMTPGTPPEGSEFVSAALPPRWSKNAYGYIMNIDVDPVARGDINGSGAIDLADAIVALKVCAGLEVPYHQIFRGASVKGNLAIGLEDVFYIMQKTAQLR